MWKLMDSKWSREEKRGGLIGIERNLKLVSQLRHLKLFMTKIKKPRLDKNVLIMFKRKNKI
jgi:hypothetical protein